MYAQFLIRSRLRSWMETERNNMKPPSFFSEFSACIFLGHRHFMHVDTDSGKIDDFLKQT